MFGYKFHLLVHTYISPRVVVRAHSVSRIDFCECGSTLLNPVLIHVYMIHVYVHMCGIRTLCFAGTVYLPHEPLFLQSLRNPFVFRCADGVMIDGNHRGLSKWIFK